MPTTVSSWNSPAPPLVPESASRGSPWRPTGVEPLSEVRRAYGLDELGAALARPCAPAPAAPSLLKQMALGLAIFAAILGTSVPLVFISEGLALGAAVAVGAVVLGLLARRLLIGPVVATLLAVLGAFATSHSVHTAYHAPATPVRLSELAPAAGLRAGGVPPLVAMTLPSRAEFGSTRLPVAGWAFPAALFALWAFGFAAMRVTHGFARWLVREASARMTAPRG